MFCKKGHEIADLNFSKTKVDIINSGNSSILEE